MNEAVFAPTPLSAPRGKASAWTAQHSTWLLCTAACVLLFFANVFRRELYTGDEGFYGVTAQNMVRSADYLVRPSHTPAGDFATDKVIFAHPPFNSYVYALGLWIGRGSLAGLEIISVLSLGALLFFSYRLLALFDRRTAACAVLLLAASPALAIYYSLFEPEPLMTTAGIAGLYFCLRSRSRQGFLLAGICLGLAFAFKLWLCGPLVLAAGTAIVFADNSMGEWRRRFRSRQSLLPALKHTAENLGLCILGGIIPSALHLLAIAIVHPEDLGFWLRDIYFGVLMNSGISSSKFSGGAGVITEWMHPAWYYAAAIYHDHFFLFPFILFGSGSLLRDPKLKGSLLLVIAAGLCGLVPLSLVKVKEPLYILSCTVFLYFLAGCCLAALLRRLETIGKIDSVSYKAGMVISTGLLLVVPIAFARHVLAGKMTDTFVLVHSIAMVAILALVFWAHRRSRPSFLEISIFASCAAAVLALFAYNWTMRTPRDETIARGAMPYLEKNSPNALSFVASNFKSYQHYLFRRGCYWTELPLQDSPGTLLDSSSFRTVRVFIIDPLDQRRPEMGPWISWLETHTTEKTRNFAPETESSSGVRVFVRGG